MAGSKGFAGYEITSKSFTAKEPSLPDRHLPFAITGMHPAPARQSSKGEYQLGKKFPMKASRVLLASLVFAMSFASSIAAAIYTLRSGDAVSIQVYQEPMLRLTNILIDAQGDLAVAALENPVHVAGLSVAEAEAAIAGAYKVKGIVAAPRVSIAITAYAARAKKPKTLEPRRP